MKKYLLYFILLFISVNIYAKGYYTVEFKGNRKTTFNSFLLNETEYIDLKLIQSSFFKKAKLDWKKFTIVIKENKLTFAPSSVYLSYDINDETEVFQMRKPAIYQHGRLFVPLNSFLISLEVLGIYSVNLSESSIKLTEYKEAEPLALITEIDNPDFLTKKEETTETQTESEIIIEEEEELDEIINKELIVEVKKEFEKVPEVEEEVYIINEAEDEKIEEVIINPELPPTKRIESEINTKHQLDLELENNNLKIEPELKKETPPNVYKIPSNLNTGNLSQGFIKPTIADISEDRTIIAEAMNEGLNITKAFVEVEEDFTTLHFYANSVIEEYQKPEYENNLLKIRILNADDAIKDFTKFENTGFIRKIESEKIRNILVYNVISKSKITKCDFRRNGPKELVFTFYTDKIQFETTSIEIPDIHKEEIKTEVPVEKFEKSDWGLDVIVLDPGHGGKDCGAVGVTGVYEKDLTLKLARKVKEMLNIKMPNTKVVLTRNDDKFLELYKRGKIANQVGGKLFISMHFNAAAKKPSSASGIETFILRPGKNEQAIRVANFENSVIKFEKEQDKYKDLNEEEIIIATMAQSSFVKFSEKLAISIQEEVTSSTQLVDRGVKQAGFYVLIGASMPNVLFEACFLSNYEEEKFAASDKGQEKIAKGLVQAILKYAENYGKF